MPDKLTDKEIVKALKNLLELVLVEGCLQRAKTISNALDLINRLQAENERLKQAVEDKGGLILIETAKAEAYKEFAELLCNDWLKDEDENLCDVDIAKWIVDTCAELVGEDK